MDGRIVKDQVCIVKEAHSCFKSYYSAHGKFSVLEQLKVVKDYPRLFSEEEGDELYKPVQMVELKAVI